DRCGDVHHRNHYHDRDPSDTRPAVADDHYQNLIDRDVAGPGLISPRRCSASSTAAATASDASTKRQQTRSIDTQSAAAATTVARSCAGGGGDGGGRGYDGGGGGRGVNFDGWMAASYPQRPKSRDVSTINSSSSQGVSNGAREGGSSGNARTATSY
ncbi:unnamed protein product, partial [Sphacelaria rigidula]